MIIALAHVMWASSSFANDILRAPVQKLLLTPRIIDETFRVFDQCRATPDKEIYNCDCVAVKYIEARTQNPTGDDTDIFIKTAQSKCTDTTGRAGAEYTSCKMNMVNLIEPKYLEQFCVCVGNRAGEEYKRPQSDTYTAQKNLTAKIYRDCNLSGFSRLK